MKATLRITLALLLLTSLGGCIEPPPGAPVESPYFMDLDSGDYPHLARQQMGLEETTTASVEGDFPFGDAVRVTCGPAASGPHPAFRVAFQGPGVELTVIVPHHAPGGHAGEQQVRAMLGRVGSEGGYLESDGQGTARIESASDRAGTFAASGTFEVELSGEAGQGTVSGTFEGCYYFT